MLTGARGGPILSWLLFAAALAQAPCPEPESLLHRADQHLVDGEYPQADQLFQLARFSFSCGPPPSADVLAHFWLAKGALDYLKDDRNRSVEAFAAAARVKPDLWIQPYGTRLRRVYDSAAVGSSGSGILRVEPEPGRRQIWIDGAKLELPARVPGGIHLVQLVDGKLATEHELVVVPEDGQATWTWATLESLQGEGPARERPDRDGPPVFLVGSIGAGALSGVAAGAALAQNGAMKRAETVDAVDAAYRRQVGFAVGSYTLLGVAATGLTLHFVLE